MRNAVNSLWNEERVARMCALLEAGRSAREIADALSCEFNVEISRCAVIGKVSRMNKTATAKLQLHGQSKPYGDKAKPKPARAQRAAAVVTRPPTAREKIAAAFAAGAVSQMACEPVTFEELRDRHCRWPIDGEDAMRYCGNQKIIGCYCIMHYQLSIKGARVDYAEA